MSLDQTKKIEKSFYAGCVSDMILPCGETNSFEKLKGRAKIINEHNIFQNSIHKTSLKGKIEAPELAVYHLTLCSIFSKFSTEENFSDVLKCLPNAKQLNVQEKILIEKYILHTTIEQYCRDSKTKDSDSLRKDLECLSLETIQDYINKCKETSEPDLLLISKISVKQTLIAWLLQSEESSNGQETIRSFFLELESKLTNFIDPLGMEFSDKSISSSDKSIISSYTTKHGSGEFGQNNEVETIISVAAENPVKQHYFYVEWLLAFRNFFFNSHSDAATNSIEPELQLQIVEVYEGDHSDGGFVLVGKA